MLKLLAILFLLPCFVFADCRQMIAAAQKVLGELRFLDTPPSYGATTKVVGILTGNHGGKRFHLERIAPTWLSDSSEHSNAPQGNPLWIFDTLGEKTARFYGFDLITDTQLFAPNGTEINGASAKINTCPEMEEDPIVTGFYDLPSEISTPGAREYVTRHGRERKNPMASRGMTLIHDLSFHGPMIYLPSELANVAAAFSLTVLDFVDYLEANQKAVIAKTLLKPWELKLVRHSLFVGRLRQIDHGTANFSYYLNLYHGGTREILYYGILEDKNAGNIFHQYTKDTLNQLTLNAASPKEFLEKFYLNLSSSLYSADFQWFLKKKGFLSRWGWWLFFGDRVQGYLDRLKPIFEEYIQSKSTTLSQPLWTPMTQEQLCQKIHTKRINVMKAVERLTAANPQYSTAHAP